MSWNKELNSLYNLAALHSWCTQIDQMIDEFINKYKPESVIIQFLINKLEEKNVAQEHYIVSLVLLNYLNYSTVDITKLANSCLYNKINKNDLLFFKEHIFSGKFPLSQDLTYDITNRSFLSAKRAIKKAMQINSVISKENPSLTVLYLTFILCRMDMNEENRAMIAFLLLKIDVDLPDSLEKRVFSYLWDYKEIIKELLDEENGNFKDIDDKPQLADKHIINKKYQNEENSKIVTDGKKLDQKVIFSDKQVSISIKNKINRQKLDKSYLSSNRDEEKKANITNTLSKNRLESISVSKIGIDSHTSEKSIFQKNIEENSNLKSDSKKNGKYGTILIKNNLLALLKKVKSTVQKSYSKEIQTTNIEMKDGVGKTSTSNNKISELDKEKIEKSWQIALKSNKELLESILQGFEESKNSKTIQNAKKTELTKRKVKYKKIHFIVPAVLLLFMSIIFVLKYSYDKEPLLNKQISLNEASSIVEDQILSVQDNLDTDKVLPKEVKDYEESIPPNFPIDFTIVENKILWKVSEGESISGVYYTLQEFKLQLKGTILEDISKMDWDELYDAFVKNNPIRTSYHIIYPSESFILPLK